MTVDGRGPAAGASTSASSGVGTQSFLTQPRVTLYNHNARKSRFVSPYSLPTPNMASNERLPALVVQRVWRGVCARRRFTELLFVTLQEQLREELISELPAPLDEGAPAAAPVAPSRRRAQTPSLEEAQEEASISQFFHPNGRVPHDPQFDFDPPPPPLLRTPGSCESMVQPADPTERYPSTAQSPQRSARASTNGGGHSRAGSGGAVPSARLRGDSGNTSESARTDAEDAEDLQFSDELASTMSTEALRDLASLLGRLSATRTKVLTSLVEKRDELRHERSQRETLVEQLLMQVDRSRSLRKVKAPGSRR